MPRLIVSSRSPRVRSRILAIGVAAALAAPLGLAAVPASAATTNLQVPTPSGTAVLVAADLSGVQMSVLYSQLDTAADTYFQRQDPADDPYGIPFPAGTPIGFFDTGFWAPIPETATVEVCIDVSSIDRQGLEPVLYRTDYDTGSVWVEAERSASSTTTRPCSTYPPLFGSQAFLAMLQPPSVDPADIDIQVTRVFEPMDIGFGDGPQNGVYLAVEATNTSPLPITLGLGADLLVEGEDLKLWLDETWGLDPESGGDFGSIFTTAIGPGETAALTVPDWPGKTYTFWAADLADPALSVPLETYSTGGAFSRVAIDLLAGTIDIGADASFAGSTVFPGVTTTIEAAGLTPGETYELWLTPGVDYLSFMILGGILADGAVQVGTATVDTAGLLATTFTVPATVQIGDRFQLMIGDPATRSWPAGTSAQLEIVAPDGGGTIDGPVADQLEVSIPVGAIDVLFTFPAGTTDGQTTASASTTGPAAVGFTMPGDPPVYLHLSTTAAFTGTVEICVDVAGGVDPTTLRLYHYALGAAGYAWVDITTRYTVDAVCGETASFSPFALGVSDGVRLASKEACKSGGWVTSTAPVFRNQGACVLHFARLR